MNSPEEKNEYVIYFENLYKAYGKRIVLDDIDFKVRKGEFCTVVGPSGCGKSTLLRIILGQERSTKGKELDRLLGNRRPSPEISLLGGKPIGYPNIKRGIVYQRYSLFPHLTVVENVMLGKKLTTSFRDRFRRSKKREIQEEAEFYLEKVHLSKRDADKFPHELSGGMQQRVAIAQSLIMKPAVLLMDEPFGALDPGTREIMQVFLLQLWEELKMTIFFVTHDLEEAIFLGTRIMVLSPFYSDERVRRGDSNRGSRIVADMYLRASRSTSVKATAEFGELIQQIRKEGFDPNYSQHVTKFNLRHPDSFQSLRDEERGETNASTKEL